MNEQHNNITNFNEYRENVMPDTTGYNIDIAAQNLQNGISDTVTYEDYSVGDMEEFVSQEFVNSYLNATDLRTPDLWNRIEAGFESEAREVIEQHKLKSKRTRKVLGFVAAAAVITVIAVPVLMFGSGGAKSEDIMYSTTELSVDGYSEETNDSVAMEAPAEEIIMDEQEELLVEGDMESEAPTANEEFNSLTLNQNENGVVGDNIQNQLKEIEGVQTDERQLEIKGQFIFDSNSNDVTLKIWEISDNEYDDFVIAIGDEILLSNPMFVLTMDYMVIEADVILDSLGKDKVGNIIGRIIDIDIQGLEIEKEYIGK